MGKNNVSHVQLCGEGIMVQVFCPGPTTSFLNFPICKMSQLDLLLSEHSNWWKSLIKPFHYSKTGFPNLSTSNTLGQIIFCGSCPVHKNILRIMYGFYLLYGSNILFHPEVTTTKIISRHSQMSSRGQNCPSLRTTFNSSPIALQKMHSFIKYLTLFVEYLLGPKLTENQSLPTRNS